MAEFTYNPVQEVAAGGSVILNNTISCNKGYVMHRNEFGVVTLKGVTNGCARFARYQVFFDANIAVPEGGTAGPISVSLAIDGEALPTSNAIVTPTVADAYFNVSSIGIIDVPSGCCAHIAVENTSDQAINVQNANLLVTRIA